MFRLNAGLNIRLIMDCHWWSNKSKILYQYIWSFIHIGTYGEIPVSNQLRVSSKYSVFRHFLENCVSICPALNFTSIYCNAFLIRIFKWNLSILYTQIPPKFKCIFPMIGEKLRDSLRISLNFKYIQNIIPF